MVNTLRLKGLALKPAKFSVPNAATGVVPSPVITIEMIVGNGTGN